MADDEKPVEDQVGKDLLDEIRANAALLSGLKFQFGQQLLLAQNEGGDPPPAFELTTIKKLEGSLSSDRMYEQARAMTRKRT